ncbi:oleosin H2-like [Cicer arietinum]|uniref:Oleosin 16.4 kDa-like n=1 Tax=Cicer arietinum TaxID=3827 RepID=A0A1S2Z6F0_CICAR|nr:oleosin 16.4 kDa-like [Cicer arietinum]
MAQPQRGDYYDNYQQHPITYNQSQTRKIRSPSASHLIVLATIVPFGATLLILAGLILSATVIGLAVTTPLFVIFSPVLFSAAIVFGLAIAGFLTSGAFGVTSLSSFAWLASYLRRSRFLERIKVKHYAKPRLEETVGLNEAHITEEEEDRDRLVGRAQQTATKAQSDKGQVEKPKNENITLTTS